MTPQNHCQGKRMVRWTRKRRGQIGKRGSKWPSSFLNLPKTEQSRKHHNHCYRYPINQNIDSDPANVLRPLLFQNRISYTLFIHICVRVCRYISDIHINLGLARQLWDPVQNGGRGMVIKIIKNFRLVTAEHHAKDKALLSWGLCDCTKKPKREWPISERGSVGQAGAAAEAPTGLGGGAFTRIHRGRENPESEAPCFRMCYYPHNQLRGCTIIYSKKKDRLSSNPLQDKT